MTNNMSLDDDVQTDLMSAAVRLYELQSYDLCMSLLNMLIKVENKEALVLAGHCVSRDDFRPSLGIENAYYEAACELGSAVGCYNLYLNYKDKDEALAKSYLRKARELGWDG